METTTPRAGSVLELVRESCPDHDISVDADGVWVRATRRGARLPNQGWKLHVSAGPDPDDVLRRCVGVLSSAGVHFKVLASTDRLIDLSCGAGGVSQVGKFITIYPASGRAAVRLARVLDAVTTGCDGPSIPSDRALRPGSIVHYRFGCFGDQVVTTPLGETYPAIRRPDGRWIPYPARARYEQPSWLRDPFQPRRAARTPPAPQLIAGRFVPIQALASSARGRTLLAIDVTTPRRCVLKEALPWVTLGRDGSDARARLAHEASILGSIADLRIGPEPYGLFEHAGASYLALEDIPRLTLDGQVTAHVLRRGAPSATRVAAFGARLAYALARLHGRGLVHRDLKPSNIINSRSGCRLLDFELSLPVGARAAWGIGTSGYVSPQQEAEGPADPADDVFALGAVLLFAATGADASGAPDPAQPGLRQLPALNPRLPSPLVDVIVRCLDPDPAARPRDAEAIADELRHLANVRRSTPARKAAPTEACQYDVHARALTALLTNAIERWLADADPRAPLFLNDGAAGGVLVLSEAQRCGTGDIRRGVIAEAARRLAHSAPPSLAGLCVGEAGILAAVLRAALVLEDETLIDTVRRRAPGVMRSPLRSPDFFHGSAGRVWFALQVLAVCPSPALEGATRSAADRLAAKTGSWVIPPGYSDLSGQAYFGFAHGTAGIAWVLTAMHRHTGNRRYRAAAQKSARRLRAAAVKTLDRSRGLMWHVSDRDATLAGPFWCHGAAGIGSLFLELWRDSIDRRGLEIAEAAARATLASGRWLGPTHCHGLSGSVEFLLDLYQATGRTEWRDAALQIGALLAEHVTGRAKDRLANTGLGLFTGFPGVLAALIRLGDPDTRPRLLGGGFLPPGSA